MIFGHLYKDNSLKMCFVERSSNIQHKQVELNIQLPLLVLIKWLFKKMY